MNTDETIQTIREALKEHKISKAELCRKMNISRVDTIKLLSPNRTNKLNELIKGIKQHFNVIVKAEQ